MAPLVSEINPTSWLVVVLTTVTPRAPAMYATVPSGLNAVDLNCGEVPVLGPVMTAMVGVAELWIGTTTVAFELFPVPLFTFTVN